MLVESKKWGVPVRRYYFECQRCPSLFDFLIPTAFFDCYRPHKAGKFFFTEAGQTLLTDLSWPESRLFSSFSRKTRNEIHRFERGSDYVLNKEPDLAAFFPVYQRFAQNRGLSGFTREDAQAHGEENMVVFSMDRNGRPEILDLYLVDQHKRCVTGLLSCSLIDDTTDNKQRRELSVARRYLLWFSIQHFKREGFEVYDWGGYAPDDPSPVIQNISRFKLSFKGQVTPVYRYYSPAFWLMEKARHFIKGVLPERQAVKK